MPVLISSQQDLKAVILRAFVVWVVIIAVETIHGVIRQTFIAPAVGDLPARQIGVLVYFVPILVIAWLFADWLRANSFKSRLVVGLLCALLTFIFQLLLGLQWLVIAHKG